jgi:hypothetical protein
LGLSPGDVHDVYIDSDSDVNVLGPENDTSIRSLLVGGGNGEVLLQLQGSELAANSVEVLLGGTLTGTGSIQSTLDMSGILVPGDSPGSMHVQGTLKLRESSLLKVEVDGPEDGQFDQITVLDDLSMQGELSVSADPSNLEPNQEFVIIKVGGSTDGQFIGLDEGDMVGSFGGINLHISYSGGDGNDVALYTEVGQQIITASSYTAFRGFLLSGTLADTFQSDNSYLRFQPGITLFPSEPPVWLIFEGSLPTDQPNTLSVRVEARVNTLGLVQTIDMFNWTNGQYANVSTTNASLNSDGILTIDLTENISRFVRPVSGLMRTRIGWKANGPVFLFPWTASVDQVVWIME